MCQLFYAQWTEIRSEYGKSRDDLNSYSIDLNNTGDVFISGNIGVDSKKGEVKIYKNVSDNWTQLGNTIQGASAGEEFGFAVSSNDIGDIIAISALKHSNSK